jgi:hypothetical protein
MRTPQLTGFRRQFGSCAGAGGAPADSKQFDEQR